MYDYCSWLGELLGARAGRDHPQLHQEGVRPALPPLTYGNKVHSKYIFKKKEKQTFIRGICVYAFLGEFYKNKARKGNRRI